MFINVMQFMYQDEIMPSKIYPIKYEVKMQSMFLRTYTR